MSDIQPKNALKYTKKNKLVKKRFYLWIFGGLGGLALGTMLILPNFMPACGCAEPTQKINMYSLQTMLETYAVDWSGEYPQNLSQLEQAAKNAPQPYWRELSNPVNKTKGFGKAYGDIKSPPVYGMVVYVPHGNPITTYALYAYQDAKLEFIRDKGKVFFLSNS